MTTGKPDERTSIPGDAKARMDRILRLHAEVDTIKEMIREVYGEEKDAGGDKTAMGVAVSIIRKRSKDSDKFDNQQGMVDLYLTAFAGASHTHAYARDDEHDPETGEITEPQSAPQAVQTVASVNSSFPLPVESEAVAISTSIQPETANEIPNEQTDGGSDESASDRSVEPFGRRHDDTDGQDALTAGGGNDEVASTSAHIVAGEGAHNASVTTFIPKPLRAYCLNTDKCGGQGRKHCWSCQKAHDEAQGAA